MTDEHVGECETWHEATLLEPEEKGTSDENALNCRKSDELLSKRSQ